ncbi:cupin domain-containing protein [Halorubrum ezzemoulense]|uniref:cupin domain-containing protein n=1 Tax=Halorubrum ezzemoulense TaxID=337243 RepID=UPI00232FD764|nr:cupin domain-containing protein [Halorubrum ezzemoulense]MDB2286228.1 cupin domain-containing protein [Halorubrum ezzemoulense]
MGYRVVDVDSVDPEPDRPCECRKLSDSGGLDAAAINRFRAAPGEQLPLAYHYHETQQEAFYVLDGTLAIETPDETYEVPADDLFVVDPESPQRAYNPVDADAPVTVLAIGAPPADGDAVAYEPADE